MFWPAKRRSVVKYNLSPGIRLADPQRTRPGLELLKGRQIMESYEFVYVMAATDPDCFEALAETVAAESGK